jgi:urease accessory protein
MGVRLLATWAALHPDPRLDEIQSLARHGLIGPTLPVAFGSACACRLIAEREAIEAFAYTRLTAAVSAAMRLMPIGQTAAHTVLARTLDRVPAVVGALLARGGEADSFTPELDIALMTHQYLHSRLFRT